MLTLSVPHSIISFATKKKLSLLGNCVTVARQTLTLFVGVRIPIPQPLKAPSNRGCFYRGVAQFGSAHRSGRWGRKFESCHLDQFSAELF